jgi:hypothetical protein
MTNILEQVARSSSAALKSHFVPTTPSEFLASRLADRLDDRHAVRHYLELAQRFGDSALLTAYRRVRDRGSHADSARSFHVELERISPRPGDEHVGNHRRLAAIRIERRAIAVALFAGDALDSQPLVRQLSSDGAKALGSAAMFVRRILAKRPFGTAAMEILPSGDQRQRTLLDQVITQVLTESGDVSVWRVQKREVIAAFGHPPLRFRSQVREAVEYIFPGENGRFGGHLVQDALALGLYCQTEFLLNL